MSKRKGRRQPLTSEIKSVLRPPSESEGELEPSEESLDAGIDAAALGDSETPEELEGAAEADVDVPSSLDEPAERAPSSAAAFDEYEAALDEAAQAIARPDLGAEEPESLAEPEVAVELPTSRRRARRTRAGLQTEVTRPAEAGEATEAAESEPGAAEVDSEPAFDDSVAAADTDARDAAEPAGAAADEDEGADGAGPAERFAEPISFDDAGDDTEGFLRGLVEALLFTSQKPIDVRDLARSAGIDKPRARELIEQLRRSYEGRGLCIEEVAGGFVMRSSPRYSPYIHKILALKPVRLSRAQLETLAIVAYRQPVTKPEVDDIRGVDSGQVIKGLLERGLLKMLGKKDEPGHPTLYGTTNEFLELLNLQSLKDLPTLREYTELSEESQRKFMEATGEAAPSDPISFERPPSAAGESDGAAATSDAPDGAGGDSEAQPDEAGAPENAAPSEDADADGDAYAGAAARSRSDVVAIDEAELGEPESVLGADADDDAMDREGPGLDEAEPDVLLASEQPDAGADDEPPSDDER